jgi:hypothetical protein
MALTLSREPTEKVIIQYGPNDDDVIDLYIKEIRAGGSPRVLLSFEAKPSVGIYRHELAEQLVDQGVIKVRGIYPSHVRKNRPGRNLV